MFHSSGLYKRLFLYPTLVLPLLLAGCNFNETVDFKGNKEVKIRVKIEGSGNQFPTNGEWYKGKAPKAKVDVGNDVWDLYFEYDPGGNHHFGLKLCTGMETVGEKEFVSYSGDTTIATPTPNLALRYDHSGGKWVVDVRNPSGSATVRINTLQWSWSDHPIPLDSLTYYDPVVAGLTWTDLVTSPLDLTPGQQVTFDASYASPPYDPYGYARSLTSDSGGSPASEIVYMTTIPGSSHPDVPALSVLGLAILMACVALSVVYILVRKRGSPMSA